MSTPVKMPSPDYQFIQPMTSIQKYQHILHLTEHLAELNAQESSAIDPKLLALIHQELEKRKINKNTLDMEQLKIILKELDRSKLKNTIANDIND